MNRDSNINFVMLKKKKNNKKETGKDCSSREDKI